MKKILTLLLAVCAVTLTSCKKDEAGPLDTLNGTSWLATGFQSPSEKPATATWVFADNTFTAIVEADGYRDEQTGTYTYQAPKVTITLDGVTFTGVVTETTLTLTEGSDTIIFNKK